MKSCKVLCGLAPSSIVTFRQPHSVIGSFLKSQGLPCLWDFIYVVSTLYPACVWNACLFPFLSCPAGLSLEVSHFGSSPISLAKAIRILCSLLHVSSAPGPTQIKMCRSFAGSVHSDGSVFCSDCLFAVPFWLLNIFKTTPSKGLERKLSVNICRKNKQTTCSRLQTHRVGLKTQHSGPPVSELVIKVLFLFHWPGIWNILHCPEVWAP